MVGRPSLPSDVLPLIKDSPLIFIFILCLIVVIAYLPGLQGAFYYDDYGNLDELSNVVDLKSFWDFISSGVAGPLGRPISLATFGLQAGAWPEDGSQFILVNVLIHLANSVVLFFITVDLLRLSFNDVSRRRLNFAAFGTTLLWALLPLNVSTTLIAIQRMTGLSAFFVLCGIWCYLKSFEIYKNYPLFKSLCIQYSILLIFALLSMFSKENGALLPIFILVLELSIIRDISLKSGGRRFRLVLLITSLLAILYYLSPIRMDWFVVSESRNFSAWERIRTEWVLMWSYIKLAIFPIPSAFSPFHDDVEIVQDAYLWILAGVSWLSVFSVSLLVRKKTYWLFFVVSWFFVGHLLESTSILLELYFEHRNYLGTYGLCLGFVVLILRLPFKYRAVGDIFCGLYVLFIALVCYATTSLWGKPVTAAEIWSASHPRSSRAALHLGVLDTAAAGGSVNKANLLIVSRDRRDYRIRAMDRTIAACPECLAVRFQSLLFACNFDSDVKIKERLEGLFDYASTATGLERVVVDALYPLIEFVDVGECPGVSFADISELANQLLNNPAYKSSYFRSRLYYQIAEIEYRQGNIKQTKQALLNAERADPGAEPIMQFQVHMAILSGDWSNARIVVQRWRHYVTDSKGSETASKILLELEDMQRNEKIEQSIELQ